MAETLVAFLRSNDEAPGGHDLYDYTVIGPYYRASDNTHWDLGYVRAEDVLSTWGTAYASKTSGLITDADPGGDGVAVRLKVVKYTADNNLADQNPDGRVSGDGAPISGTLGRETGFA